MPLCPSVLFFFCLMLFFQVLSEHFPDDQRNLKLLIVHFRNLEIVLPAFSGDTAILDGVMRTMVVAGQTIRASVLMTEDRQLVVLAEDVAGWAD